MNFLPTSKSLRSFLIVLICTVLFVFLMSSPAWSGPYDHLREFKVPMVCKPFVEKNGTINIAEEKHWVELPWRDFVAIGNNRLLFKYLDGLFTIPNKGYVCGHKDREPEKEE